MKSPRTPSPSPPSPLLAELRAALAAAGDPERAAQQQAYMKSAMPYHGVTSTPLRTIVRAALAPYPFADAASWRDDVRAIWRGATHREERYAALELAGDARARPLQGLPRTVRAAPPDDALGRSRAALAMYEAFIVEGAWWDLVDTLASHRVGPLVRAHATLKEDMRAWAASPDLWKRRAAIICQLGSKADTDTRLLEHTIEGALDDPSFWLRKAIGWALREHAKTDPAYVRALVARLGDRLSALSRREALKHL